MRLRLLNNRGFTIVELMIALSVLSTLLVMSTVILMQIGGLYSKGVTMANLQNATRSVVADVAASLQFNGNSTYQYYNDPVNPVKAYCINNTRYSFVLDKELGLDAHPDSGPPVTTEHVLWRDTMVNPNICRPMDITQPTPTSPLGSSSVPDSGYEVAPPHTRLTRFTIQLASANVYQIEVWMAYGDSDLVQTDGATDRSTCQGGTGNQFCAVSEITTSVTGRVK